MKIDNTILDELQNFGFNQYEAKCYWAVLNNPGIVGKKVSSIVDVPLSKVYGVLHTLCDRKVIHKKNNVGKGYTALPLKDLFEKEMGQLELSYDNLSNVAELLKNNIEDEIIWNIEGYSEVLAYAKSVINQAKETVLVAADEKEIENIIGELTIAEKRGIDVLLFTTSDIEIPLKNVYRHEQKGEAIIQKKKGNCTAILVDSEIVLIGNFDYNHKLQSKAVYTKNEFVARILRDRHLHEIYISRIFDKFRDELNKEFGEGLYLLAKEYDKY